MDQGLVYSDFGTTNWCKLNIAGRGLLRLALTVADCLSIGLHLISSHLIGDDVMPATPADENEISIVPAGCASVRRSATPPLAPPLCQQRGVSCLMQPPYLRDAITC